MFSPLTTTDIFFHALHRLFVVKTSLFTYASLHRKRSLQEPISLFGWSCHVRRTPSKIRMAQQSCPSGWPCKQKRVKYAKKKSYLSYGLCLKQPQRWSGLKIIWLIANYTNSPWGLIACGVYYHSLHAYMHAHVRCLFSCACACEFRIGRGSMIHDRPRLGSTLIPAKVGLICITGVCRLTRKNN